MRLTSSAFPVVALAACLGFPAVARPPSHPDVESLPVVNGAVLGRLLEAPAAGARVTVPNVLLERGREVTLELERFEVWAPDARITELSAEGPREVPVPADRYFRGSIPGEPGSLVFVAAGRTLRGMVFSGEEIWAISPEGDAYSPGRPGVPSRVVRIDPERQRPESVPELLCGADALATPPLPGAPLASLQPAALASDTLYVAPLGLDADYELYLKLGSIGAVTTYVGDLVAASSAIYQRDIKVQKTVGVLYVWSTSADPWTQTSTELALYELGDYWHANRSTVPRSTVHLLSGKNGGGGISWLGVVCRADFQCGSSNCGSSSANGHWGGAYGVSSSLAGTFSVTNPALYWDILCFSHEIGHNFNSRHTHCYTPPVDTCCSCDPEPTKASDCTGPVPAEKGTIMSYCHLRPGGYSNVKLYLSVPAEASAAVYTVMRTFVETQATCLGTGTAPTVTLVNPSSGPTGGGTPVTVTGTGFEAGATVTFGGVAATNVSVTGPTSLTATTPAVASPGVVNVTVRNTGGLSGTLTAGFTYFAGPTPVSISPNNGSTLGGTPVTINGTGFVSGATVTIGGAAATSVVFVSSTRLTAVTPAHATGTVDVTVTNPGPLAGTLSGGYFYAPPPVAVRFRTLQPCRIFDTRETAGNSAASPALVANAIRTFSVVGRCSIPATATALSVNMSAVDPVAAGELRAFPGNGIPTNPPTTSLAFRAARTRANNALLYLSTDGLQTVRIQNLSAGATHFLLDVNGFYAP